jgi:hypothetical protein
LIEHLLQAEHTDITMRSVRNEMNAAKFPLHRELAGEKVSGINRHIAVDTQGFTP